MKHLVLAFVMVIATLVSVAQCTPRRAYGYFEAEYGRSLKSENVYGIEAGLNIAQSPIYVSVAGHTFTAKRDNDNTAQVLIGPRIGYAISVSDKFQITPFVGATYNYGGNENLRTSEWGPSTGARFSLMIGQRNGYLYLKPAAVFTSNQLYTLSIGFGGLF